MTDVKVLIAGSNNLGNAEKGDVVEVVPSISDWGSATVTPDWIRLVITNVPGSTQQEAEDRMRVYLQAWEKEFSFSEVSSQRYRVEASSEIANDFDLAEKLEIRDRILTRFGGTLANQSKTHFEFDSVHVPELEEIAFEIKQIAYRRFRFTNALVDTALDSVSPGEPVEFIRTRQWVQNNIIDKLRS